MGRRGWAGEVDVDYDEQKLIMRVTASEGQMVRDLKSLSGGERSYSTLSFVLALGQANASPFHVFDEYDVFMDQNVRVIATRELLRHAKRMSSTQFILLSPQVCLGCSVSCCAPSCGPAQDPTAVYTARDDAARKEHIEAFEESFLKCISMPRPERVQQRG